MTPVRDAPVLVDRDQRGVAHVTLNRPDSMNALNSELVAALHDVLAQLSRDTHCRVVVLSGAGRGFCGGLDLRGYHAVDEPVAPEGLGVVQRTMQVQRDIVGLAQLIRRMPQVVVASVNGPAAGGGLALVLASDVRIASDEAVFATSFIRIGVSGCDIGTSWLLPRIVGAGRAHELMLTGRRFGAAEALAMGLLAEVVRAAELDSAVESTLQSLIAAPPFSLALTKQAMWLALEIPSFDAVVELENRQQVLTAMTADQGEAMAAYLEKRAPTYRNA
jgi:enoyl-CoA hydratase/carnithine racemase